MNHQRDRHQAAAKIIEAVGNYRKKQYELAVKKLDEVFDAIVSDKHTLEATEDAIYILRVLKVHGFEIPSTVARGPEPGSLILEWAGVRVMLRPGQPPEIEEK